MAALASRFGWSYETLMSMTGAERRLWLAAAGRVPSRTAPFDHAPIGAGATQTAGASPPAAPAAGRLTTEAERRTRLLELSEQYAARYRR